MSIFDQEDQFDENADHLTELTKPGGKFDRTKYASDEEMYKAIAKGKVFADRTLDHKLKEFDELRDDLVKANANATATSKFEELKALLEQRQNSNQDNTQSGNEPQLDEATLDARLEAKLSAIEAKKQEKANMDEVEKRLQERFGERAKSLLGDRMKTLNMTVEDLKFLARKSPTVALNALGLNDTQPEYQGMPSSSLRSDNFVPQVDIHDALYWEKMRRENKSLYFSEKMSIARMKDMDNPDFRKRLDARERRSL